MKLSTSFARAAALLAGATIAVSMLAGCGLVGGTTQTVSVSDPQNLFHVKVPEKWKASTDQGFLSIYADNELPAANEKPRALSVLVFTSQEPSSTSVPDMLDYLIDARAKQRGWTGVTKSKPAKAEVGGRDAITVDVTATGADGQSFESRYYFVRTGGAEVLVAAIAPDGERISKYEAKIGDLTSQWYWHSVDASSRDSSAAAPAAQ